MINQFHYTITFDGGSLGNGTANAQGYGSYHVRAQDGREAVIRLDFGTGITNNVAEYRSLVEALKNLVSRIENAGRSLVEALKNLVSRIENAGRSPADFSILIHSDSQLVVGQVVGGWKVRKPHLRPLCDEAKQLFSRFNSASRLEKRPRAEIEALLGH